MKRASLLMLACALLTTVGCATRKPPNGENYYVQATQEYSQHYYQASVSDYQKLIDEYPFSPYAEEAELNIGLAYYKMHNYPEAIGSFNDFLRMHPTSNHLDVASYYLAMSHYNQMGRPDQDQTHTQAALAEFQDIVRRFPESDFAALSRQQIDICREMLARHDYLIGQFYIERANYRAAESRMAELMAYYPDTPIAPQGLYELGLTLEKQGKKYSAAQAFTALKTHFPNTPYAQEANNQLRRLNQKIDTEEDPLKLVLAESGFGEDQMQNQNQVSVHESMADLQANGGAYSDNGLPILPTGGEVDSNHKQQNPGPATLRTVRLSSSDPPLSVILDLSGPVMFDQHLEKSGSTSTLTLYLHQVTPDPGLPQHMVFDKSIFRDANIEPDAGGTKITVNTTGVARYAVVPLDQPPRLLVTFTPATSASQGQTASFDSAATAN